MLTVVIVVGALVLGCAVYGWIEAGWLRKRVLEVPLDGLPEALDGLRIGHLSDFHLGAPLSRGNRASERAVGGLHERRPDLVCITGDLVSHPRGEPRLRALLARLDHPFVVLGNHDIAVTRDPFSRAAELRDLEQARLLRTTESRRSSSAASASRSSASTRRPTAPTRPAARTRRSARPTLRLLLCHFPRHRRADPAAASFD